MMNMMSLIHAVEEFPAMKKVGVKSSNNES